MKGDSCGNPVAAACASEEMIVLGQIWRTIAVGSLSFVEVKRLLSFQIASIHKSGGVPAAYGAIIISKENEDPSPFYAWQEVTGIKAPHKDWAERGCGKFDSGQFLRNSWCLF